jgi:inner membrane protein
MLLFAHTGITLGAAFAIEQIQNAGLFRKKHSAIAISSNEGTHKGKVKSTSGGIRSAKTQLSGLLRVDYRFILVGSMLPDIIDKPLGNFILRNTISNGRIFSHTLLFLLLILLGGLLVRYFYKKDYLLFLAFGVLMHLILDSMWNTPCTLFWPACGFAFPKTDVENWTSMLLQHLFHDPATFIPEAIGAAIVIYVSIELLVKRSVWHFIKTGYLWNKN